MNPGSTSLFKIDEYRPLLVSVAYSMLGDRSEAEDVVQDVFLKWAQLDRSHIENEKAYLVKAAVNSTLNHLNSAHKKRLTYPKIWLPEPVPDSMMSHRHETDRRSILTYEVMVLLRKLKPLELAVFVLKESFDYSHDEIAAMLDKTPEHCRQLLKRAKGKIGDVVPSGSGPTAADQKLAEQIVDSISRADIESLLGLFTTNVKLMADGGGVVTTSPSPIVGAEKVAHLLVTIARKSTFLPTFEIRPINRQPGFVVFEDSKPAAAFIITPKGAKAAGLYVMLNPAKLTSFVKL